MSDQEKIDVDMIEQLKDLLEDRFPELISRFIGDGNQRLALIKEALPKRDFQVIYAEAHGLKGSSRNIGANPLGEACDVLEESGRKKTEEGLATFVAAVEQEFAAVKAILATY